MQKTLLYIDANTRELISPTGETITRSAHFPGIERGQWAILCFVFVERKMETDGLSILPVSMEGAGSLVLVADDNFLDEDQLMLKSVQSVEPFNEEDPTSNMVNIAGDWIDGGTADLSQGQMSFRVNSDTVKFKEVMGPEKDTIVSGLYMSVKKYVPNVSNPSTIAWFKFKGVNTVRDWSSTQVVPPSGVDYIHYINAALTYPLKFQFSIDGIDWHDDFNLHVDLYQRVKFNSPGSEWSLSQPIPYGKPLSLSIGEVTKGEEAGATITGTLPNLELNLTLPKGDKGDPNTLTIGTVDSGDEPDAEITGEAPNQTLNLVLQRGPKGDRGGPPAISIGDVIEGDDAAASIDSSGEGEYELNLTLPRGPVGYSLNLKGEWDYGMTYDLNDSVRFEGAIYRSLIDENTESRPIDFPARWELVVRDGAGGRSVTRIYNDNDDIHGGGWHETMLATDIYFRESTDSGITWGEVREIAPAFRVIERYNPDATSEYLDVTPGSEYSMAFNAKWLKVTKSDGVEGGAYMIHDKSPQDLRVVFSNNEEEPDWHANLMPDDVVVKFYNSIGTINKTIVISNGPFSIASVKTSPIEDPWHLVYEEGDAWKKVSFDSGINWSAPMRMTGKDGISLNWRGSYSSPPQNPEKNDGYYDTISKQGYIFNGITWLTIFKDDSAPGSGGAVLGNADPKPLSDTPSPGIAEAAAREDHVHPNAGLATSLDLLNYLPISARGAPNGVPSLDSSGKVPKSELRQELPDVSSLDAGKVLAVDDSGGWKVSEIDIPGGGEGGGLTEDDVIGLILAIG